MLFRGITIMEKYIFENNIPLVTDNRKKKKKTERKGKGDPKRNAKFLINAGSSAVIDTSSIFFYRAYNAVALYSSGEKMEEKALLGWRCGGTTTNEY